MWDLDFHKLDATMKEPRWKAPRDTSQGSLFLYSIPISGHRFFDMIAIPLSQILLARAPRPSGMLGVYHYLIPVVRISLWLNFVYLYFFNRHCFHLPSRHRLCAFAGKEKHPDGLWKSRWKRAPRGLTPYYQKFAPVALPEQSHRTPWFCDSFDEQKQ